MKMSCCDIWGNLKAAPIKIIKESHGDNFINLFVYEVEGAFLYGYQLRLGGVVRQKAANVKYPRYKTIDAARLAGCKEIQTIGNANRIIRKIFENFNKVRYNEPSLFGEDFYG